MSQVTTLVSEPADSNCKSNNEDEDGQEEGTKEDVDEEEDNEEEDEGKVKKVRRINGATAYCVQN